MYCLECTYGSLRYPAGTSSFLEGLRTTKSVTAWVAWSRGVNSARSCFEPNALVSIVGIKTQETGHTKLTQQFVSSNDNNLIYTHSGTSLCGETYCHHECMSVLHSHKELHHWMISLLVLSVQHDPKKSTKPNSSVTIKCDRVCVCLTLAGAGDFLVKQMYRPVCPSIPLLKFAFLPSVVFSSYIYGSTVTNLTTDSRRPDL